MVVKRNNKTAMILLAVAILIIVIFVIQQKIPIIQQSNVKIPEPIVNIQQGSLDSDLIVNQQISDYDLLSNENPLELP